ncbi:MAG TPA: hypothetical protein VG184_10090 [Acidimicrobiales bacterium]|nr:hypothetical protein [Acidimicrobiales bacterium]
MRRIGLPVESLPDELLLAGMATGDAEVALAFVRWLSGSFTGLRWPS